MRNINTIEDIHTEASSWNPEMTMVTNIFDASDCINYPHEDYPQHVASTKKAIDYAIDILKERSISESDIRFIHKICMEGKEYLRLGSYRNVEVIVANTFIPPQPYLLPSYIMNIIPVGTQYQTTTDEIFSWYKEFETIHPFEDGNGRTGGTILAAMTFILENKYLVPKK